MTFWGTVFAAMIGFFLWDISVAVVKILYHLLKRHAEGRSERRIGFGEDRNSARAAKAAVCMRRIGFGENE